MPTEPGTAFTASGGRYGVGPDGASGDIIAWSADVPTTDGWTSGPLYDDGAAGCCDSRIPCGGAGGLISELPSRNAIYSSFFHTSTSRPLSVSLVLT
jgi:hypothetical protein